MRQIRKQVMLSLTLPHGENKKGTSEVCGVSILADKMGTYDIEMEMKADLEDLHSFPLQYISTIL